MHNYIKQKFIWCYVSKPLIIFFEWGDTLLFTRQRGFS